MLTRVASASPEFTLVVFHHAGATSTGYLQLTRHLPAEWDVVLVDLPGRGTPPARSLREVVDLVAPEILAAVDTPYAFFGHSMGAVVAHDVAAACADRPPVWLGVSGTAARHRLPALDRKGAVRMLRHLDGTPPELLRHPWMLDYAVRLLLTDLDLLRTREEPLGPLITPITAFGGTEDSATPVSDLRTWRSHTTGDFRTRVWPGGHFYLFAHAADVAAAITQDARAGVPPGSAAVSGFSGSVRGPA
ncbi:thioesterase II family protein [Lentzea aerocolonigenes]|uniref:thioesterase II family protein n=1 Tax=Lentzea aerocolonigenes TaxID=68170 RepID=UPI0004C3A39D|nr:alpha/beta fold hydrolase [Lentzea aerocolonigenes]MCP2243436.1 Surfactin synthase thioesterase subunit [Lentzea aerocolonigenes]